MTYSQPTECVMEICEFEEFKQTVQDYALKNYFPVDIKINFICGMIPSSIIIYFVKV